MAERIGHVVERYVYPVKGMAGSRLAEPQHMQLNKYGVADSRTWMVIDDQGHPVTARIPRFKGMVAIKPEPLDSPGTFLLGDDVVVKPPDEGPEHHIELFKDIMRGRESLAGSAWLNHYFDTHGLHLVHFIAQYGRTIHPEKTWKGSAPRAFVDGAQVHVVNANTLKDFKERWSGFDADPRRFRPDIVIAAPAHSEYGLIGQNIRIGSAVLHVTRALDRCPVPAIHPDTLVRDKVVPQMLKQDSLMSTPEGPGKRPCFGIGLEIVTAAIVQAGAFIETPAGAE